MAGKDGVSVTFKKYGIVFLVEEADDICEVCGKVDELWPYGLFDKDKGRRLRICFDCMKENEDEAHKAFDEFVHGKQQ